MSIRCIRVLAAAALFTAGVANAEIVGPVTWYSATVEYVCPTGVSGRTIKESSLTQCQYELNQELQDPNNANCELVELNPCSFHFHGFAASEEHSLPAVLVTDFGNAEGEIRRRYRIDEYEAEMGKLIRSLQPR
jgi:hypothetical protein